MALSPKYKDILTSFSPEAESNEALATIKKIRPKDEAQTGLEFLRLYNKNVGQYLERSFKTELPKGMSPDFSIGNRISTYNKGTYITVEEYKAKSPEGDELIFAMARDKRGHVYIDNIYDPRVGITDYGTQNEIANMGYMVYKPIDYTSQVFGIPFKYKKNPNSKYTDINNLWQTIPVIKRYKEELISRGIKLG